jgi:chemotaxis regulatin CheY-phosphate phosphatase CheZ
LQKLYRHSIGKKIVDLWIKEFEKLNILANKILMALQFQDITSQQLQAANHLISQVQNKLGQLMNKLGQVTPDELTMIEVDEQTFNENAEYVHSENRQKMIDEIEASFSEGEGGLSQEEIDRLAKEALNDNTPEKDAGENDE